MQSINDYEDGDLESAVVAQRLIQSCSPGVFPSSTLCFCYDVVAAFGCVSVCVLVLSGAAARLCQVAIAQISLRLSIGALLFQ